MHVLVIADKIYVNTEMRCAERRENERTKISQDSTIIGRFTVSWKLNKHLIRLNS